MASKKIKRISCALILAMMLASCNQSNVDVFTDDETKAPDAYVNPDNEISSDSVDDTDGEETEVGHGDEIDNPFVETSKNPVSFVHTSAQTSSYKHFRDLVNSGYSLSELKKCSYSFKNEEFLNYLSSVDGFDGDFYSNIKISPCSWNTDNYLLKFTLAAARGEYSEKNNIVFYIDVSESMSGENMLAAVTGAAEKFADALSDNDVVSVVISAADGNVKLDSANGADKENIVSVIEGLYAQGSENNHDLLYTAYDVAKNNRIEDGQNTVIIVSDGDISDKYGSVISENANDGIKTSVIAVGSGNYKSEKLQEFSTLGGGEYYYVDGKDEAEAVLGEKIFYSRAPVANNLSVKVDFNESVVEKYRLIGYEGMLLSSDSSVEAVGNEASLYLGENITLCYEITLADAENVQNNFADITVKYNSPSESGEIIKSFYADSYSIVEDDCEMKTLSAAIEMLMVLRSSSYGKNIKLSDVYNKLSEMDFNEYPKAEELYNLLGIITGKIKK